MSVFRNCKVQALVVGCVLLFGISVAQAQDTAAQGRIGNAIAAMEVGDDLVAEAELLQVISGSENASSTAERTEAYRLLGLLKLRGGKVAEAREAFLQYLLLDPNAHLDPALVPPEAVSLLEDVRAQHSTEIDLRRKKGKKRYLLLNLVPGAGQIQNGARTKGIVLSSGIGLLLATNLTTYFLLKKYCDNEDRTCRRKGKNIYSTAESLKSANLLAGYGAIALYVYSIYDGVKGYREHRRRESEKNPYMNFSVQPIDGGASANLSMEF